MKSSFGRFSVPRLSIFLRVLAFIFVFFVAGFYVLPLRNLVLQPVWPRIWREVSSIDVIMINQDFGVSTATNVEKCPFSLSPNSTLADVRLSSSSPSKTLERRLKDPSHRSFLPIVDDEEKRKMLHLYLVLSEALKNARVEHFFVDGSLLGVVRHGGFVPWDDDIDITINVTEWQRVRITLSCINGYRLDIKPNMHWKFYPASSSHPFIDIFFYTENESYLWAIPHYIKTTMVFLKSDVFPLKTAKFENLQVPVPNHAKRLANNVFDLNMCQSPSINHQTGQSFKVYNVPCSSLTYLYHMQK